MISRKRSLSEMKTGRFEWTDAIDQDGYGSAVLQLRSGETEDGLEQRLLVEAHELGIDPIPGLKSTSVEGLASSFSATTIESECNAAHPRPLPTNGLTSCSSSERRQVLHPPYSQQISPTNSMTPSLLSSEEKRSSRYSLRTSLRRMTGFRRRKSSVDATHASLASIDGSMSVPSPRTSLKNGLKSPLSIKSYSSSSSSHTSPIHELHEHKPVLDDEDSIKRTTDAPEMQAIRGLQLGERDRFIAYQRQCLELLREQHQTAKQRMRESHGRAAAELEEKNLLAADDLESRQLEAEANFRKELEAEKRACLIRLRHMEAYCHSPSPPTTPRSGLSQSDEHLEQHFFPERKVTEKDYHNLAAQYRERDAMDSLHKAKIEVMQGRQEKVYNDFVKRKEKELAAFIVNQGKEEIRYADKCEKEEEAMTRVFDERRQRLQVRWKLQDSIQRVKLERITGLHYAALPELSFELELRP